MFVVAKIRRFIINIRLLARRIVYGNAYARFKFHDKYGATYHVTRDPISGKVVNFYRMG